MIRPASAQAEDAIDAVHARCVADAFAGLLGDYLPPRDRDGDRLTTGELRVLMVDAVERGRGVGLALVAAGEQAMRECGLADATLWVAEANTRALRFYERCGWRADGTKRVSAVDGREIKTVRYRTRVAL